MSDIEKLFNESLKHITFDEQFYTSLQNFRVGWMSKNQDNIEFLGGKLLGSHPIRFTLQDTEVFFVDLLNLDEQALQQKLYKLKDIHPERKVTSNAMYHTLIFLIQKAVNNDVQIKDKEGFIQEAYYIFAYKVLGSLMSHYFKYDLDKSIGLLVLEKLSGRFQIKQEGNWQKVLEKRSGDFVPPDGLHAKRLKSYTTINASLAISDAQTRLRDIVKQIWAVLDEVLKSGETHTSSSLVNVVDGETSVGEILDRPDKHVNYIKLIIHKEDTFVKRDLIKFIIEVTNSKISNGLEESLRYLSKSVMTDKTIDNMLSVIIVSNIGYLKKKNVNIKYDESLTDVILKIRGLWSRNKTTVDGGDKVKKQLFKLIRKGSGVTSDWRISSLVISTIIYIFVRAILGKRVD